MLSKCFHFLIISLFVSSSIAAPKVLTYQGRIVGSNGLPLEYSAVSFEFRITNPAGDCVIYREQKNGVDMSNSKGVFDTPIGLGTKLFPADPSFGLLDAFSNSALLNCEGGATYTPVADDGRLLRVQFHDGSGWKLISPDNIIRSVPYSAYSAQAADSKKVGGQAVDQLVLKTGIPVCSAGYVLTSTSAGVLSCIADTGGASGVVNSIIGTAPINAVDNGSGIYTISATVGTIAGTLAAGNDSRIVNAIQSGASAGGDLTGTLPNPTVQKISNVGLSFSSLTSGQFLKYNGTNWINAGITQADVSGLATTLSGVVLQSQFPASCAANQTLTFISPSGSFSCSSIAITGGQVSGNIAGNAAGFTGSLAGDITGTQSSTTVSKIQGVTVTASAPALNQVLKYNGAQWAPAALSLSDLPSGALSGSGTAGYIPYYSAASTLANSPLSVSGSLVGLGLTNPTHQLELKAAATQTPQIFITNTTATDYSQLAFASASRQWNIGIGNGSESATGVADKFYLWDNNASAMRMVVDTSGNVGIGTTSPGDKLHVVGGGSWVQGSGVGYYADSFSATASAKSLFVGRRARGTSSAPTQVQANDQMTAFLGANQINENAWSGMTIYASENQSSSAQGAEVRFATVPNGTTTSTDRMVIANDGSVGIGTTTPNSALDVYKSSTVTTATDLYGQSVTMNVAPTANLAAGAERYSISGYITVPSGNSKTIQTVTGLSGYGENNGTGSVSTLNGVKGFAYNTGAAAVTALFGGYFGAGTAAGTITALTGFYADTQIYGGTITDVFGVRVTSTRTAGTMTNRYGVYVASPTGAATNDYAIYTAGSQKSYFAGSVGIGVTSPSYKLDISGDLRITGIPYRAAGDIAWTVPSDARLKDVSGSFDRGLNELLQLDMIRYHYKKNNAVGADSSKEYIGVLAQNVQKVIPEAVNTDEKTGYLSLNTTPIFWSMINAIKDLYGRLVQVENNQAVLSQIKQENEVLRAKNLAQEKELAQVKDRLEKIERALNLK